MPSHLEMSTRRDRRKNFRVEWNLPATIYDADRHLERPCTLGSERTQSLMNSEYERHLATVDRAGLSGAPRTR